MILSLQQVAFGSDHYRALLQIREEVLRIPIGMVLRQKDTATDADEYHLAAFEGEQPIGCVLLRPLGEQTIQLRQMAVIAAHQGQGIGARLVHFAESVARNKHFTRIETKARKTALGFYTKLGYAPIDAEFIDADIATMTIKMQKWL